MTKGSNLIIRDMTEEELQQFQWLVKNNIYRTYSVVLGEYESMNRVPLGYYKQFSKEKTK